MRIFTITENGFCMDGTGRVSIPACRIKASSFIEASSKLSKFLSDRELVPDIELITPFDKIAFSEEKNAPGNQPGASLNHKSNER